MADLIGLAEELTCSGLCQSLATLKNKTEKVLDLSEFKAL